MSGSAAFSSTGTSTGVGRESAAPRAARHRQRAYPGTTMRRALPSPLPRRHGLEPAELRLPADGEWATVLDYLHDRLPWAPPGRLEAMLDDGEIVDRDGPLGPARAVPAGHVDLVPPRPAGRGAGAVRDRRPLPGRRPAGGRQAALPGHDPARPARPADGAGTAAHRARPAGPEPGAPAGPDHRRGGDVRRPPRAARRLPVAVRAPAGAQGLRGGRALRPARRAAGRAGHPDRQGARGARGAGGARASRTADTRIELVEQRGRPGRATGCCR